MYNKEDYRDCLHSLLSHYKRHGFGEMSLYSALTGIPTIVVYELLMEAVPEEKENCEKRIKAIKDFFGYK